MVTTRYYIPGTYSGSADLGSGTLAAPWTTDNLAGGNYGARSVPPALPNSAYQDNPVGGTTGNYTRVWAYTTPAVAVATSYAGGTLRAAFKARDWLGTTNTKRMVCVVRRVSAANVILSTVMAAVVSAPQPGSAATVLTLTGTLDPVTLAPGEKFRIEMGATFSTPGGGQALYLTRGTPTGAADLPYLNGSTAAGQGWVEFAWNEPPNAPTGLAADPGPTSADLTWTAPATGPAPTGYEYRVDGGAPVAIGSAPAVTVDGLIPLHTYTVEVRATATGLASAWVPVTFTTLVGADYRAVVRLGSRTWDVLAGDPPELGPILPVVFGWAIPEDSLGFPAQPDAELATLELVTADYLDMDGVDIGSTMRVSIYDTPALSARPVATFRGRVADLEAAPAPQGLRWRVLGVGYTADPGTRQVGTADWPQESSDARAARIMAEAGYPGWAAPAIGNTWEARSSAPTSARELLQAMTDQAVSADGTPFGPARRVLVHPVTDAAGELVPAGPFAGSAVLGRTDALDFVSAGLVNRATSWRRTKLLDATWVKIDHPGGPTVYGDTRGTAYPPQSAQVLDPQELADLLLDTTPGYRWLTGQALRLELWADGDDQAAMAVVKQWFYRDPASPPFPWAGRAVIVEGIDKTPDGSSRYAGMLAAATMRLEHVPGQGGRMVVEFRLRPEIPAHSTVTRRWMDEPAGASWADELAADPTGTWYDYYTQPRP